LKVFLEMKADHPLSVLFRNVAAQLNITNDWGFGPILYGSIVEWILQDRKGIRKFHNFEQLLSLVPHQLPSQIEDKSSHHPSIIMNYIYVGDIGEYDDEAGRAMLQHYPQCVRAVFLHVVYRGKQPPPPSPLPPSNPMQNDDPYKVTDYIHGRPIIYFRTYVGAALSAVQQNLVSRYGLELVIKAVRQWMKINANDMTADQELDLQQDIKNAHQFLESTR
jgi:hypothetical protein